MFRSRLIGQHLSDASRDLATLIFDLGGHCACRWWVSSCSVCVPRLKFVGLPVRKILRTSGVSISRPGDLYIWPLTLKMVRIIARKVDNLPTNIGVSRALRSRLISQHLSDASRDIAALTFDLRGHSTCCWCGSSCSVCVPKPNLGFLGLSILELCWGTEQTDGQTDRQTDRHRRPFYNASFPTGADA